MTVWHTQCAGQSKACRLLVPCSLGRREGDVSPALPSVSVPCMLSRQRNDEQSREETGSPSARVFGGLPMRHDAERTFE